MSVFCATSDNGPDIASGRDLIAKEVDAIEKTFLFDGDCLAHQYHLHTGDLLTAMDEIVMKELGETKVKYYSSLAALCHVLRDNHAEVFSYYRTHWADTARESGLWKICPRPLSGRWGRKTQCESYVLGVDPINLSETLKEVLKKRDYFRAEFEEDIAAGEVGLQLKAKAARHNHNKPRQASADDAGNDAYKEKYGKWSTMAINASENHKWWFCAALSNRLSETLDRLLWCIEKRAKPGEVNNLARLLTVDGPKIRQALTDLLDESHWEPFVVAFAVPVGSKEKVVSICVKTVLRLRSVYDCRIMSRLKALPVRHAHTHTPFMTHTHTHTQ